MTENERKMCLEDAIFDYIKNNQKVDSVDIVLHFGLRADITLSSIHKLIEDKRIKDIGKFRTSYITI